MAAETAGLVIREGSSVAEGTDCEFADTEVTTAGALLGGCMGLAAIEFGCGGRLSPGSFALAANVGSEETAGAAAWLDAVTGTALFGGWCWWWFIAGWLLTGWAKCGGIGRLAVEAG